MEDEEQEKLRQKLTEKMQSVGEDRLRKQAMVARTSEKAKPTTTNNMQEQIENKDSSPSDASNSK